MPLPEWAGDAGVLRVSDFKLYGDSITVEVPAKLIDLIATIDKAEAEKAAAYWESVVEAMMDDLTRGG
jgi:hypothetical protein